MAAINTLTVTLPVINSSCIWASNTEELQALYDSHFTGAVTTETATLTGFPHTREHRVAFIAGSVSSVNSYGYASRPLTTYLSFVKTIISSAPAGSPQKPFIISISSSSPTSLDTMILLIQDLRKDLNDGQPTSVIAIEFNTSCPNIQGAAPPAYNFGSLRPLLRVLARHYKADPTLTIGLKLPPYVFAQQFTDVIDGLSELSYVPSHSTSSELVNPIAFLTCTNTLGTCLVFEDQVHESSQSTTSDDYALPTPLGGLSGDALFPIALGNVYSFTKLLENTPVGSPLRKLTLIGVGGVTSADAANKMRRAGAQVVGCATLFGKFGVKAFEMISEAPHA